MNEVKIKKIDGLRWALDVMNGQRSFPTFNKSNDKNDFDQIFKEACKKEKKKA